MSKAVITAPDEMIVKLPEEKHGKKPFLLNFVESTPFGRESFSEGVRTGTKVRSTSSNDILDYSDD